MKPSRIVSHLLFALALVAAFGCQSDSPTEPSNVPPSNPVPPLPVTTFAITVTPSPGQLTAGTGNGSTITIDVRRTDTGQPPPDLTPVTVTTNIGSFGAFGSGSREITLQLVNGRAQTVLFADASVGTATVRAVVGPSAGAANVAIGQAGTFFLSSVTPSVGSPQGGEEVSILGGGFDDPVRVTFNGTPAQVRSVTPTRIRVLVPPAVAAGVDVGVGQSVPVNVSVTINLNETGTATDSLPSGFTYSLGGTIQQPAILSVTPNAGTNDGGTRITITGDGFQAPVQVLFGSGGTDSFNGIEATVLETSPSRLVVLSPTASGFGQNNLNQLVSILVRNLNTGFATVRASAFKYGNQVLITAMGPGSGPYTGGTRVTIFGQGFDEPVAISLGGVGQTPVSVTGTEVVFITSGVPLTNCPANGIVAANGIQVTNIDTGNSASANLGFNFLVPLPLIFGVSPQSGNIGSNVTLSGQNFSANVQVLFGDATNGASASIVSKSATAITVRVPTPPQGFTFSTEPCEGSVPPDNNPAGTRNIPTAISVTVRNLDGTGCVATLSNAFTLNPPNAGCNGDTSVPPPPPPVQCTDGFDNDGDTFIDAADPQCTGPTDNSESS
ncbi:MAG TPA: IPT/TIG domain-containing protein [Thermoanaerobaculia bacterium]|nr:IPT/TIG domain-containing protein [Thermoanaerobaculia bacterium]